MTTSADTLPTNAAETPTPAARPDLRDLAREAIQIQDACNLTGLALGWHKSACRLREALAYSRDSDRHPINRLWYHKLADLAGVPTDSEDYSAAYAECRQLAGLDDARI